MKILTLSLDSLTLSGTKKDIKWISTNKVYAGMHWGTRKRIAEHYHKVVAKEFARDGVALLTYPVHLVFVFSMTKRLMDCSNVSFMGKMIEDGLVSAGLVPTDTIKHICAVTYKVILGDKDEVNVYTDSF